MEPSTPPPLPGKKLPLLDRLIVMTLLAPVVIYAVMLVALGNPIVETMVPFLQASPPSRYSDLVRSLMLGTALAPLACTLACSVMIGIRHNLGAGLASFFIIAAFYVVVAFFGCSARLVIVPH